MESAGRQISSKGEGCTYMAYLEEGWRRFKKGLDSGMQTEGDTSEIQATQNIQDLSATDYRTRKWKEITENGKLRCGPVPSSEGTSGSAKTEILLSRLSEIVSQDSTKGSLVDAAALYDLVKDLSEENNNLTHTNAVLFEEIIQRNGLLEELLATRIGEIEQAEKQLEAELAQMSGQTTSGLRA